MTRIDFRSRLNTHMRKWQVLLDGEDITLTNVFLADDETGEIGRYLTNAEGKRYFLAGTHTPATEHLRGKVTLVPPLP